jgi:hypothetical protein
MKDRITVGRALTEATVIVGSILLAFSIDASWDEYRERRDERAVLSNLEAEFVANLERLETVVRRHEGFAERAAELDAMSEDEIRAIPAELVDGYERALGQWMTFEPRGGVLASLVGDGRLGLVTDAGLRDALVEWLQRLDDSAEEAGLLVRTSEKIAIRWNYFGDIRKTGTAETLAAIRSDPEMIALTRAKLFFGGLYAGELRRLSDHGQKVLDAIRANRD